ncbi:MAG: hypothetical protein AABO57_03210 [Acidobacteriota bacterium]
MGDASGSGLEDHTFDFLHFLANVRHVSFKLLKPDVDDLKVRVNHFELCVQQLLEIALQVINAAIGLLLSGFRQIVHRHNQRDDDAQASKDCGVDRGIHLYAPSIVPPRWTNRSLGFICLAQAK